MHFNCPCGERYEMLPTNTSLYTYTAEPKYNWFETECPKCKEAHAYFFLQDEDNVMPALKRMGCSNLRKALAPDNIKDLYEELMAKDDETSEVHIHELSPRLEAEIAKLAHELATTPDEWIQEIFSHPPPKSNLPVRWT